MIFTNGQNIKLYLNRLKIQTRPNASQGLWLMFLLPVALIASATAHPIISTPTYKVSSIFSLGLILSSLVFLHQSSKNVLKVNYGLLLSWLVVAVLFRICLHRGVLFSTWSAFVATVLYHKLYIFALQNLPDCFTLGEGAVFFQGYILLLHFTTINIVNNIIKPTTSVMQMSTLTIQLGLIGLSTIILLLHKFKVRQPLKIYMITALVFINMVVLPLHLLIKMNPLLWILNLFWEDLQRNKVLLYWFFFSIIAVIVVNQRIKKAKKASTSIRKIFHFLTVAVFIPGLLYNCSLLYLASGVILGIFFMLEILRVLNVPPLAETLQNGIVVFSDEKDAGIIAFTPMYLLSGCALPLWIHPAPCDVTNSAIFNLLPLLSGLLTIGIGDTAASIVGSKFGRHYWRGSKKTIEGTMACICSQLIVIVILVYFDYIKLLSIKEITKTVLAVVITAIIEAKTDQVDNLVLPFVMYTILIV